MSALESSYMDRSKWPAGEWDGEPDRVEWTDEDTRLTCLAHRGPSGHWCGYVAVPKGHPLWGTYYGDECDVLRDLVEARNNAEIGQVGPVNLLLMAMRGSAEPTPQDIIDVHGGLTYSDTGWRDLETCRGVYSSLIEDDGELWWFGFDCAHAGDLRPEGGIDYGDGSYKTLEFVREQCRALAAQLGALCEQVQS